MKDSRLGAESPLFEKLVSLPGPKEKIVVAVYKFRDQTGQYKASDVGASWSTAVTQGSTSILLRAVEESGWFIPIERESLSNLLNERKIIRSSRASHGQEEKDLPLLPPLLYGGILLEGGIVSFDSNILTGGAGARYFGAGASTQYREDRVTIYLRAVSTSNGRILKTVYTSKTILSQKIDVGFFRFVKVKRLMEAETGFTYNEPGEMAIKEAIEKAVISLVIEGVKDGLWAVNDAEAGKALLENYTREKTENLDIGVYGDKLRERRTSFGMSVSGGALYYNGDISDAELFPAAEFAFDFLSSAPIGVSLQAGYGRVGTQSGYRSTIGYSDISLRYRLFNQHRYSPYVKIGGGLLSELENNINPEVSFTSRFYGYGMGEAGFEYLFQERLGLHGGVNFKGLFSDDLDEVSQGRYNDFIWQAKIGLTIYLGN
ncbi:MAG TPA: CsgG/HfaB family protein [Chryseosolibacter sp.]|nr:CsgG/HfaB family protein [Chryseosolibacter sp.]